MTTIKMSSDEARTKWREVLDTAVAGNQIVIERYGKPVAVIMPHSEYVQSAGQTETIGEETAVYQTRDWEIVKAELLAELMQELLNLPASVEPPEVVNVYSPRLVRPEQAEDFKKEIIAELPDANI